MLRSVALTLIIVGILPMSFVAPFAGVLLWTWTSLMAPQELTWGFARDFRWGLVIGAVTIFAWLLSRERKFVPLSPVNVAILLFIFWFSLTTYFAMVPEAAAVKWDIVIRIMILALLSGAMINNKVRAHAMVWVIALSVGYFGAKGGAFVLVSGGGDIVYATGATGLGDRNQLALALAMTIPLLNYLRLQSDNVWIRRGLMLSMALTSFAIVGTYSRGGMLGLVATGAFVAFRSRAKLATGLAMAVAIPAAFAFMPAEWWSRMSSIGDYETDASADGRLTIWRACIEIGLSGILGGGFNANEYGFVVAQYAPGVAPRAAHSIFFEVFAEQGVIGFSIWCVIMVIGWSGAGKLARLGSRVPDLVWASDFGRMAQASLVGYFVSGAFLSFGYWTQTFLLLTTIDAVRRIVLAEQRRYRSSAHVQLGRVPRHKQLNRMPAR